MQRHLLISLLQDWFSQYAQYIEFHPIPCKEILESITYDLLEYLECRDIDPCNLLIGRLPSHHIADTLQPLFEIDNHQNDDNHIEKPYLYDLLQRWCSIGMHANRVMKEIGTLFGKMQERAPYQKGDIVVVKIDSIPEQHR